MSMRRNVLMSLFGLVGSEVFILEGSVHGNGYDGEEAAGTRATQ